MSTIVCSFVSDGSSDAALLPLIRWAVEQHAEGRAAEVVWADLSRVRRRPRTLADRIAEGVGLYPCDILFVHRDAEAQPYECRESEIAEAITLARERDVHVPYVCLIPVRMQEAWLLLEESAIRRAAGNPNGAARLDLPAVNRIERIPDPKRLLYDLLCIASELSGRRLRAFQPGRNVRFVPEYMGDMTILRQLPSFQRFENEVREVLNVLRQGQPNI